MSKKCKQARLQANEVQLDLFAPTPLVDEKFGIVQNTENNIRENKSKCNIFYIESNSSQAQGEIEAANNINNVHGLTYVPSFINQSEQDWLLKNIDAEPWLSEIKRRVQHYGYKYDYAKH